MELNFIWIISLTSLVTQTKCAYPVDIVTERVKGTIAPPRSILLEVPEFDQPLLQRRQNSITRIVKMDYEKPILITSGYFYKVNQLPAEVDNPNVDVWDPSIPSQQGEEFPLKDQPDQTNGRKFAEPVRSISTVTESGKTVELLPENGDVGYLLNEFKLRRPLRRNLGKVFAAGSINSVTINPSVTVAVQNDIKSDSVKIDSSKMENVKIDSFKMDNVKTDNFKMDSVKIDSILDDIVKNDRSNDLGVTSTKLYATTPACSPIKVKSRIILPRIRFMKAQKPHRKYIWESVYF